jgi:hypothetical protein
MSTPHDRIATPECVGGFSKTVLGVAVQIERGEQAIRATIRTAAESGDCPTVIAIIDRWERVPTDAVLLPEHTARYPTSTGRNPT